ncbi:MAG: GMC oxidoreductase, partial [Litorilinea sp.]
TRATGVEYLHLGSTTHATAAREVILCGGAVNSPHLLLLSGIGPAAALHALEIPVGADLPGVGSNLQDHVQASVIHDCTQPLSLAGAESLLNLLRFFVLGNGPYTSNVGEGGIFVKSAPEHTRPDLEIIFAPNYSMRHGFDNPPGHGYTLAACVLRPSSRGHITLKSPDPLAAPAIQPNYLTTPEDLSLLRTGLKLARKLAAAPAFAPVRGPEVRPGPTVTSDAELEAFIRQTTETLYHPVGTCKMGNDPQAVVDARLRVHGVTGLRVVDASIMPTLIGGNTNAPVIMIAEKAADMIREDAA